MGLEHLSREHKPVLKSLLWPKPCSDNIGAALRRHQLHCGAQAVARHEVAMSCRRLLYLLEAKSLHHVYVIMSNHIDIHIVCKRTTAFCYGKAPPQVVLPAAGQPALQHNVG